MRIFIAPAGAEILRVGTPPIVADEHGVGEMVELKGVRNIQFTEGDDR